MRRIILCLAAMLAAACTPPTVSYDVLIVNGTVYDGTLNPGVATNIGVVDDRIVSMKAAPDANVTLVIDATGKIVVPGFIDPHTHAIRWLLEPETSANLNYLRQGVSTVFFGNDGYGVHDREQTLKTLREQGVGTNVAFFAGHGLIRETVMGKQDRAPTATELQSMRELVGKEMRAGALGLSTSLYYVPGSYAETSEIIELAKVAADAGGIYDSHMRSEGSQGDGILAAVEELITISREADIPAHISHIKLLGQDVWGQSADVVALVDAARSEGLEITANQYPWEASGTSFRDALIPRWVLADSPEKMAERLQNPELESRITDEIRLNLERRGGPEAMLVTEATSDYVGMTLAQISVAKKMEPLAAAVAVVLEEDPSIVSFVMNQNDIDYLAVRPWVMTGSDGGSRHPRVYGTFPKAWRDFVVDRQLMTTEAFVHRSSGLVADTFGLCGRGYLRKDYVADIAVIDPESFRSHATYQKPTELSTGVDQLLVNGVVVIDGTHTSKLSGQVLEMTLCN